MADLSWVDTWIANVRPYIFVRLEDNLLIKRPNQAQKLNAQGAMILKELVDGKTIVALLDAELGPDRLQTLIDRHQVIVCLVACGI